MMRGPIDAVITVFALLLMPMAAHAQSTDCAASKLVVGACVTVHGRMTSCNGVPNVRIWVVGTKRILGVADAAGNVAGEQVLTGTLDKEMSTLPPCSKAAWGDFTVCPLTPVRPGVMQTVCLADAKKVTVKEW